ncbi:MAG: NHLP bacteriocin export ABC transporter permease/ATPase subunit [Oscillibacter sp.]|nr:NHLP bacteriocin export ABC transporter permease/ATPase subunit [Oscillibacter sp.]
METVKIRGGEIHYTENPFQIFTVDKGPVLVYLVPEIDGKPSRRLFLCEVGTGERIPAFFSDTQLLGKWYLGIVALDTAALSVQESMPDEGLILQFAGRIGLRIPDPAAFEEEIIEYYNMTTAREAIYITATQQEQDRTKERSLRMILDLFHMSDDGQKPLVSSRNDLYDAAAWMCRHEKISIAGFDRIKDCCGRRFTIHDIARVSHFPIRSVILEESWYRQDCGAILAFREKDGCPIACIPKGPSKYTAFDPKTRTSVPLTEEMAKGLKPEAFMFYRPFPEKAVKPRDLFLFGLSKVYKSDLVRLFLLALVGTLVGLLIPYMNEQAYDKFIPMGNASGLAQLGVVLLACSLGNISFSIVKNLASFRSMNAMEYAAQSATFDRLFNLPESFFRQFDAANLGQRAMGIATIFEVIANSITTTLLSAVFSLMYLWRMYGYSKSMSNIALLVLAVILAVMIGMGLRQTRYEKEKLDVDYGAYSMIFQFLSGISKVRIAGAEDRAMVQYLEKSVESRRINTRKESITILVNTMFSSAQLLFSILFYYMMIRQDIKMSIGAFTGFSAAFGSFSNAMMTVAQNFLSVNQIKPIYDDARPILETLPEVSEEAVLPGDIQGEIELNNVTFSYKAGEAPVLNNLSLHIKPGEYIGIVGSSGCGKSTLLKLLLGFERPQVGKVYYDNRDIDELDKRELRKKFGVVLQDGGLISGSIYDNIIITAPTTKMARVEEVIREVGLEEDIKRMPMGLHTIVSEGAGTISGGQTQRILIARAIVGKPKVIFLDEATSALDNVTQNQVVETLEKLKATKIAVAHRLSTVAHCDRIIVMDAGRIVEQGSYEELMAQRGQFYDLAIRQIG